MFVSVSRLLRGRLRPLRLVGTTGLWPLIDRSRRANEVHHAPLRRCPSEHVAFSWCRSQFMHITRVVMKGKKASRLPFVSFHCYFFYLLSLSCTLARPVSHSVQALHIAYFASNCLGAEVTTTSLSRTSKAWHVVAGDSDRWNVRMGSVGSFLYFRPASAASLGSLVFSVCVSSVFLRISTGPDSEFQFVRAHTGSGRGGIVEFVSISFSFLHLLLFISFPSHLRRRH